VVQQRLGRAIFKSNSIENTVGGALVMDVGASADYLSIEGNQFANLGVGFNSAALPFFGVLLIAVKRADVVGNLFANVARQAVVSPLRVAIMAMASGELRVAGNRLFGIGPLASFIRRTIGIGVTPGFTDVAVDDNTVARVETDADKVSVAEWQAILIIGSLRGDLLQNYASIMAAPGLVMLPLKSGVAYLSAGKIDLLNAARGSVMVRGNRLHGHTSQIPTADILEVQCCLFDQNDIRVTDGSSFGRLAGRILGDHASVANNRFAGSDDTVIFELVRKPKYSVLGNLSTGPILVNLTALPSPWDDLNVLI